MTFASYCICNVSRCPSSPCLSLSKCWIYPNKCFGRFLTNIKPNRIPQGNFSQHFLVNNNSQCPELSGISSVLFSFYGTKASFSTWRTVIQNVEPSVKDPCYQQGERKHGQGTAARLTCPWRSSNSNMKCRFYMPLFPRQSLAADSVLVD